MNFYVCNLQRPRNFYYLGKQQKIHVTIQVLFKVKGSTSLTSSKGDEGQNQS